MTPTYPKKLIEVALPLPEINDASSYDKMPGIGPHPKGIHHWWARLPLPCARAVLFASVVTDPSDDPAWKDKSEAEQAVERERLFGILRRLMWKKLHEHPEVYEEAHREMLRHCEGKLPPVLDPFSGGGSIPLEAARLGFEANAADLNPVAVLLNKCNLELAPRWAGHAPVNPEDRERDFGIQVWTGSKGLAADVRYYGRQVFTLMQTRIGHLYPKVQLPKESGGGEAPVIAWLWARTVASQDPAAKGAHVPLVRSFSISNKGGKVWVEPIVNHDTHEIRYQVRFDGSPKIKGTMTRTGAKCLFSDQPIELSHIRSEGRANRLGQHLIAIVAEGRRGKIFLSPDAAQTAAANIPLPQDYPDTDLPEQALGFRIQNYGFHKHWQMFTPRQLTSLVELSDAIRDLRKRVISDSEKCKRTVEESESYATAVQTFLALALDRFASFNNAFCRWNGNQTVFIFTRAAIPMLWDFAEANTMGDKAICWLTSVDICADALETILPARVIEGRVQQADAAGVASAGAKLLVSTDPPYYDNIGYAVLSDFYYIWVRRTVGDLHRPFCDTMLVPKIPELTASPERFGGSKERAKEHFEAGFRRTFTGLRERLDPRFPLSVYYAFKQEDDEDSGGDDNESDSGGVDLSTGWETLLEAMISSGLAITATWPVRASFEWRMRSLQSNALASYIVLACRPRPSHAPRVGRNAFVAELKRELPPALHHLQQGNVAPVDFAQAAIGPGMAVFSRYAAVLESSGKPMSVRTVLGIINGMKDELLGESVEELDKDTRWAVQWFSEDGFEWGDSGKANLLANAQATSMSGLVADGILEVKGSKVRLIAPEALQGDWDPETDKRVTVWEMTHHLLRVYYHERRGDAATAALLRKLGTKADVARDLAYKLFTVCENRKWSREAQAYNALVMGWPELVRLARETPTESTSPAATTGELF